MELRHLRYFVAIGEEENYRRAAQRLHVAQTALSTQIQDLEAELGFKVFDRLPRGVKLSVAGRLFLEDARRILREVNEAAARAARVARGQSGTLRVGFTENASWHGVVPVRSGSSGSCSLMPSCNSIRRPAWSSSTASGQDGWTQGSSSTCRETTRNWTSLPWRCSMSNLPRLKGIR